MTQPDFIGTALLVVLGLVLVFVLLVVMVKVRRDRYERASRRHQQDLVDSWRSGQLDWMVRLLTRVAHGRTSDLNTLAAALVKSTDEPWFDEHLRKTLVAAVDASGLRRRLKQDLASRSAPRRGLAVRLAGFPCVQLPAANLAPLIRDPDPTVRLATVASLEHQADNDAARVLVGALEHGLLPAQRIVERLGHEWATSVILESLQDLRLDPSIRASLLRALSLSRDPRAVEIGLDAVTSSNTEVRIQALRILDACSSGVDPSVRRLIAEAALERTGDPDATVRALALTLLGRVEHEGRAQALFVGAQDPDWFVRRAAARSLVQCGEEGIALLREIADGPDAFAAGRAREELEVIGDRP